MPCALMRELLERSVIVLCSCRRRSCRLARELALRGACAGACPPGLPDVLVWRPVHAEAAAVVALQALRNLEPGNHGWTQHTAPEGYCYYYNSHTGVSQWERPLALDFPISHQP